MLKVIIVDDDSIARTSIKTLIEWGKYGFEISGEAANGATAINLIDSIHPHVVITDMSMPVMDGVALIGYIELNYPAIKVIALSGYDDFEYVRQSMKSGAIDYILKHKLDAATLINVLETAKTMISRECQSNEQFSESMTVLRQEFIKQLVKGVIRERTEIERKISKLELGMDVTNLSVVVCKIDDYHFLHEKYSVNELNKVISSFLEISGEILKESGKSVISPIEDGKFIIIFSFGKMRSDLFIYNHIVTTIDRIKVSIKRYLNITACFSLSSIFNDIAEISRFYNEADKALQDKFFFGKDRVIKESSQVSKGKEFLNLDIEDEKGLINALKTANEPKLNEILDKIFERLSSERVGYKSIQMICADLINIISRVIKEFGFDVNMIYTDDEIPYDEMKKYETLTEVKQWILGVYEKFIKIAEASRINPDYSDTTKKAIEYIQRNYSKNISLNDVADYTGVNSSYLSRIFKKECGKGFVEYLNMVRVEHAKHLIHKGNLKLKDVVREVGFNNYTYFFKVFKDNEGMTPLEYEALYR